MQERTNRIRQIIVSALLVVGIIGVGFLIYVVVDHLSSDAPAVLSGIEADATPSAAIPQAPGGSTNIPTGIRIGQRAPDFRLLSLDLDFVSLSDYLGKVVILDFWASWCGPCRQTMPKLDAIAQSLAADVVLLGVNLDRTAEDAVNYLTANSFDAMLTLYGSYAAAFEVHRAYGNGGIPKTFVLDREGVIRYVGHPASMSRRTVERLL